MESFSLRHDTLKSLPDRLTHLYEQRQVISSRLRNATIGSALLNPVSLLLGGFYPSLQKKYQMKQAEIKQLKQELEDTQITLSDEQLNKDWVALTKAYEKLLQSTHIWRILSTSSVDGTEERTPATLARSREEIKFEHKNISFIKSIHEPLFIVLNHGAELFIYPDFSVHVFHGKMQVRDPNEVMMVMDLIDYIEEGEIAKDTDQIRSTWEKANLDGTMDKRYAGNKQIPIVLYGLLTIVLSGEKKERLLFSNTIASSQFMQMQSHLSISGV